MSRKIFVNLPVKDLSKSRAFYGALGFSFNEQFSDDTAACVVISEDICAMILTHEKFRQFTPHDVCDANEQSEVLICLSCDDRKSVDDTVAKAVAAGGRTFKEPMDFGFMYGQSFKDPDGHIWELMFMDPTYVPKE